MRSPTSALLWEIWRRDRIMLVAVLALTVAGRAIDLLERVVPAIFAGLEAFPLVDVLWMASFLILFGVFNYTESTGSRRLGRFPRRLFTLPVSSLRLVSVPTLAGIASVELLYLLWLDPSRGGASSVPFDAVLLAALMVFYQAILWTLDGLGSVRLVLVGIVVVIVFGISLLPSSPPVPPPLWRTEGFLGTAIAAVAAIVFAGVWSHVVRLRSGGGCRVPRVGALVDGVTSVLPRRQRAFRSPNAAQFWFEWRCCGLVLPVLTGSVLVLVLGPLSWLSRHDASDTLRFLIGALLSPVLLAIPVGMGFAKPSFWTEDLSIPAFIAVRPLADEDIVATKVTVAMASAAVSWLLVLAFVGVWLSLWGNLDSLRHVTIQLWAMHGRSAAAVAGVAVLIVAAGMCLTWRLLVSRLWTGLSGRRAVFIASAMSFALAAMAALVFDARRIVTWLFDDPAHMTVAVGVAAAAVVAKYVLAAYSWRRVNGSYLRQYALVWLSGTGCFAALGILVWRTARLSMPLDTYPLRSFIILLALLAVPVARLGAARSSVARNRHR
jgi:hypothetical protein